MPTEESDLILGLGGNDNLSGGLGDDTLIGGAGNDTLIGGGGTDTASYASATAGVTVNLGLATAQATGGAGTDVLVGIENLIGSSFNDVLTGSAGANRIEAGVGNDILTGGAGADTLLGGEGNDLFVVSAYADHASGEVIVGDAGTDELRYTGTTAGTLVLGAGVTVERVVIGTGTAAAAVLTGTTAINVDASALAQSVTMVGNAGANRLSGSAGNDTLDGGAGNDTLIGGAGDDSLVGGLGNDTYVTDGDDILAEAAGAGIDLVQSSADFTLGANFENLTLTGDAAIYGTGNALANRITGNAANNTLDGSGGSDTFFGGLGDDIYVTDGGDTITEGVDAGVDVVLSSVNYTLGTNVEALYLTGTGAINGTGNALDNGIFGNDADNVLNGGTGSDWLEGGAGNDTFKFTSGFTGADIYGGIGIDTIDLRGLATTGGISFEEIEVIYASDENTDWYWVADPITFHGGAGLNVISGGTGNDTIYGGWGDDDLNGGDGADSVDGGLGNDYIFGDLGDDTLNGGAGNDDLEGGAGSDTFVFNTSLGRTNWDWVYDFDVVDDTIWLENAVFTGLANGVLAASAFAANLTGQAADASDRIIYQTDTGNLYFDADGNGAGARVLFATLDPTLNPSLEMTNADFFVF